MYGKEIFRYNIFYIVQDKKPMLNNNYEFQRLETKGKEYDRKEYDC